MSSPYFIAAMLPGPPTSHIHDSLVDLPVTWGPPARQLGSARWWHRTPTIDIRGDTMTDDAFDRRLQQIKDARLRQETQRANALLTLLDGGPSCARSSRWPTSSASACCGAREPRPDRATGA
jgi:hypothetical protein